MPVYLAPLAMQAYRIEAMAESGVGPTYPDFYTPLEWEAFLTLKYARAKDRDKDAPKSKPQASAPRVNQSHIAHLARLSRGG